MRFSPKFEALLELAPEISGLDPRTWIVVEGGLSREEVKELFLERGVGFTASAIQDSTSLARWILGELVDSKRVLGGPSRQEVLRRILSNRQLLESLPEAKRLRRQRDFYKKLDRAIQSARMTYASSLERDAQEERLAENGASGFLRREIQSIIEVYEAWLAEHQAWDPPRLALAATAVLGVDEVPLDLPERIVLLSAKRGESRSEAFIEALSRRTLVERMVVSEFESEEESPDASWEEWHTVDDCCERLADALFEAHRSGELAQHGVLLPDQPAVRRSLKRALADRGLLPKDPRDPTRLRWEESIKTALLPLEIVAKRFRHEEVIALIHSRWLRFDRDPEEEFAEKRALHQEILDRGIRMGLESYSGDRLERVRAMLELLNVAFAPRTRIESVSSFHLAWIRRNEDFEPWVAEFFESVWTRFEQDLAVLGDAKRGAPILYWLERLKLRLREATPPFEKSQIENGVEIFRLGQLPLRYPENLWCLAIPPGYASEDVRGDYYYSDREREILSGHFQVQSSLHESEFKRKTLKFWLRHAERVVFLDALYDWDGRERESIEPVLEGLGLRIEKEPRYSHPRWNRSYLHPRTAPPREILLPPLVAKEIRASDIEAFSRCEMQGLILGRWKAKDAKTSDLEIRGDSKGTLLHEAARILVESRNDQGEFSKSAPEALEEAWESRRPKGLFQGRKLAEFTRRKLVPVLESFMAAEAKYVKRSRTRVLSLEGPRLRYVVDFGQAPSGERDQMAIIGVPDRIDEHEDGIFILDYKSGGDSPTAGQMVDQGYRLQLPLYALAASNHFGRPALGIQFVTLSREGSRSRGIFFKKWNGKETGCLTEARSNNASLIDREPEAVWGSLASQIEEHARRFREGHVHVLPKAIKEGAPYAECERCFVRDACGQRRFLDGDPEEDGE